jgi:hypothetical protein
MAITNGENNVLSMSYLDADVQHLGWQSSRRFTLPLVELPSPEEKEEEASRLPDLKDFIDGDSRPTFIVPISPSKAIPFQVSLWNNAFESANQNAMMRGENESALHFRTWTQTFAHWKEQYEFSGRIWTAFKIKSRWKCIRAVGKTTREVMDAILCGNQPEDPVKKLEELKMADARLASLYGMMEMSDVGE